MFELRQESRHPFFPIPACARAAHSKFGEEENTSRTTLFFFFFFQPWPRGPTKACKTVKSNANGLELLTPL